ncbi:DUF883 family protein [Noviherbaspirillum sp. Root189]|uniref:DUF883 family protein n=1 Tax=Noviherbaspirillum sp. Root189 TaxID=1736487 RepID=UPI00070926EB|nr:DUF883 family protein [Noviherbaspirillum sp. Root189]KRB94107.1 hypothetical protein ASE07_00785 [Noviherbaspirillum sp. Root189]
MLNSNIKTVRNDMRTLIKEAQDLFREATQSTGGKADELRAKGLSLLDTAMDRAQEVQGIAVEKSKVAAQSTDEFVQTNPWKAVGIAAGAGLVVGLLLSRR